MKPWAIRREKQGRWVLFHNGVEYAASSDWEGVRCLLHAIEKNIDKFLSGVPMLAMRRFVCHGCGQDKERMQWNWKLQ